jgi:hypothetical protein
MVAPPPHMHRGFLYVTYEKLFDLSPQRQGKGKLQRREEKKIKFSVVEYAHTHTFCEL